MATIRETVWKLRTDPFFPTVDVDSHDIPEQALVPSLNPLIDKCVVPLYFDVYDWSASHLVCKLSPQQVLDTFPTARTLPGTGLFMLISGSHQTGVKSLANLMLHKIALTEQKELLVIDVELESRDKVRNLENIAIQIISKVKLGQPPVAGGKELAATMKEEFDIARELQKGVKDATYSGLFRIFRTILQDIERTLVIEIMSGGDNDSWMRIHESTRSCCPYMIVMTPDYAFAKTCYDAMISSPMNIAWVQAKPLDQAKATQYLEHRLAAERLSAPPPIPDPDIFPFTQHAIAALYEPGSGSAPGTQVNHPVGEVRRTLSTALSERQCVLDLQYAAAGAIDPAMAAVGRAEVIAARDKINAGRRS